MVYLALYKGKKTIKRPMHLVWRGIDALIRLATFGKYSHCEIAIMTGHQHYECYSSSLRDGGLRVKVMRLPSDKWDLIALLGITPEWVRSTYDSTKPVKYHLIGAIFGLSGLMNMDKYVKRFYCSQWCGFVINLPKSAWRSPNHLFRHITRHSKEK